jgi:hypothetical protein
MQRGDPVTAAGQLGARQQCLAIGFLVSTMVPGIACGPWRDAADAADDACLRSVNSQLMGGRLLSPQPDSPSWREWGAEETSALLARLDGSGLDCRGGLRRGPDLRKELRIRTHLQHQNVEVELWLASRPRVRCCLR